MLPVFIQECMARRWFGSVNILAVLLAATAPTRSISCRRITVVWRVAMFVEVRYELQTAGRQRRSLKYEVIAKEHQVVFYMQPTASLVILVLGHSNIWR